MGGSNSSIVLQAKEAKNATLRNLMALSVSQAENLQSELKDSSADNRALQQEVKHKDAMVQHLCTQIASLSSELDISGKVSVMQSCASTHCKCRCALPEMPTSMQGNDNLYLCHLVTQFQHVCMQMQNTL